MSTSPTPSEREASDKSSKIREDEEQSKLPYKWTPTIQDVDVSSPIAGNIKGRDLDVKITPTGVKAAIKGQAPIIEVSSFASRTVPCLCLLSSHLT